MSTREESVRREAMGAEHAEGEGTRSERGLGWWQARETSFPRWEGTMEGFSAEQW